MLKGKTALPGVTGSIAVCKTVGLASMLVKKGVKAHVLMTENVARLINPITPEGLTGSKCLVDTFDRNFEFSVEHVALAKRADVVMVTPASVNVVRKIAHGITDDVLTTTVMAYGCKEILTPATNTNMYESPILQNNLGICRRYGIEVIIPAWGCLVCGDTGVGEMSEPEVLYECTLREAGCPEDLTGRRILVAAGPIRRSTDPMRHITNHSMGKMGCTVARVATYRGANVTLVSGPADLDRPLLVGMIPVGNAGEMFEAVTAGSGEQDIIVKAAVVVDYRPPTVGAEKIKKSGGDLSIAPEQTDDILGWLGQNRRDGQFLCGFSMETQNMLENPRVKLAKRQVDMIVANNLRVEGAGFGTDTNVVTLITRENKTELPIMPKEEVTDRLLIEILKRTKGQGGSDPA